MSQSIQPYRDSTQDSPLAWPDTPPPEDNQGAPVMALFKTFRRRWATVLLVWAILVGLGIPYVWITKKLTYTASAQVQVDPALTKILYEDENSQVMPFFTQYLNTQAHLITSKRILEAALADPRAQDCPIQQREDPLLALRRALKVEPVPATNLLEIKVTQETRESAEDLAAAVVDAYMTNAVEAEAEETQKKRKVLETNRQVVKTELEHIRSDIRKLAEKYGTDTDATLDLMRHGILESTQDTKKELEKARLQIIQLEDEINQLKENSDQLAFDDEIGSREEAINSDPMVQSYRDQVMDTSQKLVQLRGVLTDESQEVINLKNKKDRLEEELEREKNRAGVDWDQKLASKKNQLIEEKKTNLNRQLLAAQRREKALEEVVKVHDEEGMELGQVGLEIKSLQQKEEEKENDFYRITDRLKQLDIESQRQSRIMPVSNAEVRPEGINDSRFKWTVVILGGGFFAGLFVALIKDRMDPNLQGPGELETGMGLPVLGSVPRLHELRAGKVTQEDFLESYRVVRAALAGMGNDGNPPQTILVTSAQAGEAKTSLAVGLATSLAERPGARVLLIDGDLQAPVIGKLLKLSPSDGMNRILTGDQTLAGAVLPSPLQGVDILPAESNGGTTRGLLDNRMAAKLVKEAIKLYDHVIIDSPPVLGAADAMFWSRAVDGVIVSSLAGHSDMVAMRIACQRLRTVSARLLGAVVGNVSVNDSYYSASKYRSQDYNVGRTGDVSFHRDMLTRQLPEKQEESPNARKHDGQSNDERKDSSPTHH